MGNEMDDAIKRFKGLVALGIAPGVAIWQAADEYGVDRSELASAAEKHGKHGKEE